MGPCASKCVRRFGRGSRNFSARIGVNPAAWLGTNAPGYRLMPRGLDLRAPALLHGRLSAFNVKLHGPLIPLECTQAQFTPLPHPPRFFVFHSRRSPRCDRIRRGSDARPASSIEHTGLFCSVLDPDALKECSHATMLNPSGTHALQDRQAFQIMRKRG